MTPLQAETTGNAECPWDEFDPEWYVAHNYRSLREDDRWILQHVRDHFASARIPERARGIDVGSGANLYPSLAMLPFCDTIRLCEHSSSNVAWLEREVRHYSQSWDAFWDVLASRGPYARIGDPREAFQRTATVLKGSLFQLSRQQFDLGTMFFVAESITARMDEFRRAVDRFVGTLKPGRPFAAAFMKNSTGYRVGQHRFPAVAIDDADVKKRLEASMCSIDAVYPIPLKNPIREGYDGMILALGRVAEPRR